MPERRSRSFPAVESEAAFEAVVSDESALRPGVDAIVERLGLLGHPVERMAGGSVPVYGVGPELVLKVFAPYEPEFFQTERAALKRLEGRLPIPTPRLLEAGEQDGWPFVLMSRLSGRLWSEVETSAEDGRRLARELGEAVAALHGLEPPDAGPLRPDWESFVSTRRVETERRQRELGLADSWADQIDGFLAAHPVGMEARVLLHTELMREHVLVDAVDGRLVITGLFDFEPSMVGEPDYELASVGLFVSRGEPGLLTRFLEGCGRRWDAELALQAMGWALLHRYAHLPWFLGRIPPAAGVETLEELALQWWCP